MAAYTSSFFFVAAGWRLMSYGTEDDCVRSEIGVGATSVLRHGKLGVDDLVVPNPTLLPSMASIRISSISSG